MGKASAKDRQNLKDQIKGMAQDTNKAVISAIQRGQATAKKVEEQAKANINAAQKALQGEISERLEVMADGVYKGISKNRGRGLSAVGDFLTTVAALSGLRTKPAEGPGAGGKTLMPLFGGKKISVATSWSKTY